MSLSKATSDKNIVDSVVVPNSTETEIKKGTVEQPHPLTPSAISSSPLNNNHIINPPDDKFKVPLANKDEEYSGTQNDSIPVFVKSVQGRRRTMEDRYLILNNLMPNRFNLHTILGVFDGHGGSETAQFCRDNFQTFFQSALSTSKQISSPSSSLSQPKTTQQQNPDLGINGFMMNGDLGNSTNTNTCQVDRAKDDSCAALSDILRDTFLALDVAFAQQFPKSHCGTTALVVGIDCHRRRLHFANVGDSAATVIRLASSSSPKQQISSSSSSALHNENEESEIVLLNDIHNTENESEAERIEKAGGFLFAVSGSTRRVNGSLTITRAIGDTPLKQFVIGEPETESYEVEPSDDFLILASDGFYDAIPFEDVASVFEQLIKSTSSFSSSIESSSVSSLPNGETPLKMQQSKSTNADIATLLCEEAQERNNSDNITVICVPLK